MGNKQSNFKKPTGESDQVSDSNKRPRRPRPERREEEGLAAGAAAMGGQAMRDAYKRALAGGAMDVAYSRVLFLGTAGVGKTSFKRSLMKLPWEPNTTSTVVSDISKVRPFTHEWHTLKEDQWRVVSYEDEIEELAGLILAVYKKELEGFDATPYTHKKSSQSVPETHSNIIFEVKKIIFHAFSYIKKNPTLPLKPQPFLHFWDCGGQPPFLEILPVFLTSRTLFFLIFDAEKDLKSNWKSVINIEGKKIDQEEVHMTTLNYMLSWMSNIHGHLMTYDEEGGFCEFPRMYCIGTHGDHVKDRKLEIKKELEQHYQSKDFRALIEDTVIVDNTSSGKGEAEDPSLQALRDAVIKFTQEALKKETPLSWILFRKVIQVLSKKYNVISLEDAHIIGAASKIPVEDMHHVLMFYHELGVLLFYPQIDVMKDMIVINPNYIVDALGELFPLRENFDGSRYDKEWKLFHECGILVQPLYVKLWGKYKDISSEIFIKVLVYFRIAVEVKTDKYPPPSKQYFMPLVLKSTQVNSSLMTLPSDSNQAAPLHITFNSGFVPPGFFTRFVVVLTNKMELWFEKGVYKNHVTFRYQDPNSTSIEHIIVADSHDVIQINVLQHHHPDSVSFTKICQDIRVLLEDAAKEVKKLLMKCASGGTADNVSTQYIFMHEFKFVCTSCHQSTPPHYIILSPINQTRLLCEIKNKVDYRAPTEQEKVWFKDTSEVTDIARLMKEEKNKESSSSTRQCHSNQSFIESTPIVATTMSSTATAVLPNSKRRMKEGVLTSSDVSDVELLDITGVYTTLITPQISPTTPKSPKGNDPMKEGVLNSSDVSDVELLDIDNLGVVFEELQSIDYTKWKRLGICLGLRYNTLESIKADYGSVESCLLECMAAWLKGKDEVRDKGGPSWSSLATALDKIGENKIASNIRAKYCRP